MVEHAAHNGIVVGSNPTKFLKMLVKNFKKQLILKFFKNIKFFFFLFIPDYNFSYIKKKLKLTYFSKIKIFEKKSNNLMYNSTIKNNIYLNSLKSCKFFVYVKNYKYLPIQQFLFVNNILLLNLNNKVYLANNYKLMNSLHYVQNKLVLYKYIIINFKYFLSK